MSFTQDVLRGVVSSFRMTSPPLYRYPYRNSLEAFRGDWKHIGGDIEAALESFRGSDKGGPDE